jgi:hypothetical protein
LNPSNTNVNSNSNSFYSINGATGHLSSSPTISQQSSQSNSVNKFNGSLHHLSSSSSSSNLNGHANINSSAVYQSQQQQQAQSQPPQIDAEETDKVVGYGAFGVVWSVTDPRSGRRVALKKMPNVFQTVVSAKRVFREVKMLCTLKHDNVR